MPSAQTVDKSKLTAAIESAGKLAEKAGLARTGAFVAAVAGVLVLLAALGAGLEHETTARCRQLVRFRKSKLIGYYGRLDSVDIEAIAEALPQLKPEEFTWLSDE